MHLTVLERENLVGEQCPGLVTLRCEGMDLTSLRWRYNGTNKIQSFIPTSVLMQLTQLNANPAFVSVQLINVTQTPNDARFAEFISILIVDINQFQTQNIQEINCGDPGTINSIEVNVATQPPTAPNSPMITTVTLIYTSGMLNSLSVQWTDKVSCQ